MPPMNPVPPPRPYVPPPDPPAIVERRADDDGRERPAYSVDGVIDALNVVKQEIEKPGRAWDKDKRKRDAQRRALDEATSARNEQAAIPSDDPRSRTRRRRRTR
jgi:hypothetical protein